MNTKLKKDIISIIKSKDTKYQKLSNILKLLFVDIAGIDQNKYYILGSFAIREYRTIGDLDINLDENEFLKLAKIPYGVLEFYNGQIRWFYDITKLYNKATDSVEADFSIEAFQKSPDIGFPNNNFSLNYLVKHNSLDVDSNGHQFFSLKTLLNWKTVMGREKDKADIVIINNILSKNVRKSGRTYPKSKRY